MCRTFSARTPVVVGIARLQRGDDPARFVAQRAQFVERGIVARPYEAAVALEIGQFVIERRRKLRRDRRIGPAQRRRGLDQFGWTVARALQFGGKATGSDDAVADRRKIARAAARDHEARERTGEVGRGFEPLPCFAARLRVGDEMRDRVMPPRNRRRVGERRSKPLRQEPRARRRHRAVDGGEQRARPFAGKRADQFQVGARRLIDQQRRVRCLAHRRRERRALAELRALHIGDAGGRGGELEPRQRAERLGRRHRKVSRQPALGGGAVEHVARKRRDRRQRAQIGRQLRVAVERVRDDDLARFEPRNLGREAGAVAFGDAELGGRNVDPGEREAALLL